MAIQAAPVELQQQYLDVDPDRESWVYVKPATQRMNLLRGELLKLQEFDSSALFSRVVVNPILLQNKEIWLASPASDPDYKGVVARIVISQHVKDEEEPKLSTYFDMTPEGGWTERNFYEELERLPSVVVASWCVAVRTVNRDWFLPFA